MDFIRKVLQMFIQACREAGLSDKDISEAFDKSKQTISGIKFDDKDAANQINSVLKEEQGKLGK